MKFIATTLVAAAALTSASVANAAFVVLPPPVIYGPVYRPPVIVPTCTYTVYGGVRLSLIEISPPDADLKL
jgi:hypothetical protein